MVNSSTNQEQAGNGHRSYAIDEWDTTGDPLLYTRRNAADSEEWSRNIQDHYHDLIPKQLEVIMPSAIEPELPPTSTAA